MTFSSTSTRTSADHQDIVANTTTRKSGVDLRRLPNTAPNCSAIVAVVIRLAHRQSPPDPNSLNATTMPVGSTAAAIRRSGVVALLKRLSRQARRASDGALTTG